MTLLTMILLVLLQIDSLWASLPAKAYPLDKPIAVSWASTINSAVSSIDIGGVAHPVEVLFLPLPEDVLGGTKTDPTLPPRIHPSHEMQSRGRQSLGCLRTIALSTRLRYPTSRWFETVLFIPTIAHEIIHTYQGMLCTANDEWVESSAELGAWALLAELAEDNPDAERALLYDLRHRLILAALDLSYKNNISQGSSPHPVFLDDLQLTEEELEYYTSLSPEDIKQHNEYWTVPLEIILTDDDGVLEGMATPSEIIDARTLYTYLQKAKDGSNK